MTSRRRLAAIMSLALAGWGATFVACGFPSPLLSDEVGEAGAESGSEGGAKSDAGSDGAIGDAEIPIVDGADPDANIPSDAGQKVDAAGCAVDDCDCDNDGANNLMKAGCADAGGDNDCDDSDQRYRPKQEPLDIRPDPPATANWNCSKNGVEKYYASNVSCGLLALGACAGVSGFSGDPACGVEGEYVFCQATLVLCGVGSKTTRVQACN